MHKPYQIMAWGFRLIQAGGRDSPWFIAPDQALAWLDEQERLIPLAVDTLSPPAAKSAALSAVARTREYVETHGGAMVGEVRAWWRHQAEELVRDLTAPLTRDLGPYGGVYTSLRDLSAGYERGMHSPLSMGDVDQFAAALDDIRDIYIAWQASYVVFPPSKGPVLTRAAAQRRLRAIADRIGIPAAVPA